MTRVSAFLLGLLCVPGTGLAQTKNEVTALGLLNYCEFYGRSYFMDTAKEGLNLPSNLLEAEVFKTCYSVLQHVADVARAGNNPQMQRACIPKGAELPKLDIHLIRLAAAFKYYVQSNREAWELSAASVFNRVMQELYPCSGMMDKLQKFLSTNPLK